MMRPKTKSGSTGIVSGGEARGVPGGSSDRHPPNAEKWEDDSDWIEDLQDFSDRDFGADEDGGPDRRRDPLRR